MNLRLIEFPRIKFEIQRKIFEFQSLIFEIQSKKFEFQRLKRGKTEIFSWKYHKYASVVNMESKYVFWLSYSQNKYFNFTTLQIL